MSIITAKDEDLCSRCKNSLRSLSTRIFSLEVLYGDSGPDKETRKIVVFQPNNWFFRGDFQNSAPSSDYLAGSALTCTFCSFILSRLSPMWEAHWKLPTRAKTSSKVLRKSIASLGNQSIRLGLTAWGSDSFVKLDQLWIHSCNYGDRWDVREVCTDNCRCCLIAADADSPAAMQLPTRSRRLAESSNSAQIFEFIEQCIQNCESNHVSHCAKTRFHDESPERMNTTGLPARILDVSPSHDPAEIRLLETDATSTGRYVALSHCWGSDASPSQTTKENKQERLEGIPIKTLSRTFQDAVYVTRALGVHYLWIDSLCIVQGDEDDWRVEAGKMADYYGKAWLTIAASYAASSREGLFDANRTRMQYVELPYYDSTGAQQGTLFIGGDQDTNQILADPQSYRPLSEPDKEPLSTRAWTMQEIVLSRRVVFFTKGRVFWSCRKYSYDEMYREYYPETHPGLTIRNWWAIVERYTKRHLSHPTDKLIALEGIRADFEGRQEKPDTCIFGIWKSELPSSLCWYVNNYGGGDLISQKVPSWSWASLSGKVCHLLESHPSPDQLRCKCVSISGHRLVLEGSLITISKEAHKYRYPDRINFDTKHTHEGWSETTHMLPVAELPDYGLSSKFYMLLTKADISCEHIYQRIGAAEIHGKKG